MKNRILSSTFFFFLFIISCLSFTKCSTSNTAEISVLGVINYPSDNLNSEEKVELGKKLFFDKRLSKDETVSCATCHVPSLAFTDGKETSDGVYGRKTTRNAPSILNAAFLPKIMFDAELPTLEMQVIVPIQEHTEMGMNMKELILKLRAIPEYRDAAKEVFNREFDPWVLTRSISAYERTLISDASPFDLFYYKKQKKSLSKSAQRGWKIFSEELYCTKCHSLPNFTTFKAENNGYTTLESEDLGRFRIHFDSSDVGKFKVPSLRNISLTAPYMHDGKMKTLNEVIDFYEQGGGKVYNQSEIIKPFKLSSQEKLDLIEFLKSLEDVNPKYK